MGVSGNLWIVVKDVKTLVVYDVEDCLNFNLYLLQLVVIILTVVLLKLYYTTMKIPSLNLLMGSK